MLTSAGRAFLLKVVTGQLSVESFEMGLYTNAVVWSKNTVLADLAEVAVSGYARQPLAGWTPPDELAGGEGHTEATSVTFLNDSAGAAVCKGFFYRSVVTGVFLGGDAFPADLTIPATSGSLSLVPSLVDTTYP